METPEMDPSQTHRLQLLYVKALFLEHRYRECILACRNILLDHDGDEAQQAHPLRNAFMTFYLALSHDELARAVHSLSHAKIPAFDQAAHLYDEAVATLPTADECIAYLESGVESEIDDGFEDDSDEASPWNLAPSSRHDSVRSSATNDKPRPWSSFHSTPLSPLGNIRHSSPPVRSPPMTLSGATSSDLDDLESHDSFNDIMTPNRMPARLERDYSSMSLIAPAQKQPSHRPMRLVRMVSPAKRHPLHDAPTTTLIAQQRSRLPRLNTSPTPSSPARKQLLTESEQASPIDGVDSPVSPLGSEGESPLSDLSTISPISPETPMHWRPHTATDRDIELQSLHRTLHHHIHALRTQLQSHQALLQTAKLKTRAAQLDHSLAQSAAKANDRALPSLGDRTPGLKQQTSCPLSPSSPCRAHKQSRILAGRARDWRRERFDPARYAILADEALAEL